MDIAAFWAIQVRQIFLDEVPQLSHFNGETCTCVQMVLLSNNISQVTSLPLREVQMTSTFAVCTEILTPYNYYPVSMI